VTTFTGDMSTRGTTSDTGLFSIADVGLSNCSVWLK